MSSPAQNVTTTEIESSEEKTGRTQWSAFMILGVVFGLAAAGLMTATMFWVGNYYAPDRPDQKEVRQQQLKELQATDQRELNSYGWIDQSKGVVRIPIDRAMTLLVEESRKGKSSKVMESNSKSNQGGEETRP